MEKHLFTIRLQAETQVVARDDDEAYEKALQMAGSELDVDLDTMHVVLVEPMGRRRES